MSIFTNFKRVSRYGFIGFIRNGFVSLAAVLIMIITLFTLLWVVIAGAGFQSALQWLSDQVDITVYFTPEATSDQIAHVQSQLSALPQVASTTLLSSDQVLAQYKQRHQNEQLQMQALAELGANPFGPELQVRAKETNQYAGLAKYLTDMQQNAGAGNATGIDKVSYQQNEAAIERLNGFINALRTLGLLVGAVLAGAALLITFNTIRLAIYTARDEIGVMNIVGAGRWFVRGPFIVAGILYGLVGSIIVLLVSYPLALWLGPPSQNFFGTFNVFTYFTTHFPLLLAIVLGSGIVLGALSSFFAVRRYLRT